MKLQSLFFLMILGTVLTATGCSNNPAAPGDTSQPGTNATAQREIENELAQAPELDEAGTYENTLEAVLDDPASPFSTAEAIRPVFFFREIKRREHTVTVEIVDDTTRQIANVHAQVALGGIFHIVTRDTVDGEPVRGHVQKELRDRGRMRARFVRYLGEPDCEREGEYLEPAHDDDDARRRWRLAAVSHRRIASPEHTAQITSVRLQSGGGLDVTITDPLELVRFPLGLPHAVAGERVRVTVQTADASDDVFLSTAWGRKRLMRTEEGFVGGFLAPLERRHFRIGVNALDHGTLFDDQAPYDSDFWGLLAWTVPADLATH
jgi:ribosomal protein L35AE/L33A